MAKGLDEKLNVSMDSYLNKILMDRRAEETENHSENLSSILALAWRSRNSCGCKRAAERERERENGVRTKREKLNSVEPFDFMVKIITIS